MSRTWVTVSVVLAVLLATFLLDLSLGESFDATPDWTRTVIDEMGHERVPVEWEDEGVTEEAYVAFPESLRGERTLEIRVRNDSISLDWISGFTYVIATVIGSLLGMVVDMSLRGYGYVRGTGKISETPDLNVGEERGFYWRS